MSAKAQTPGELRRAARWATKDFPLYTTQRAVLADAQAAEVFGSTVVPIQPGYFTGQLGPALARLHCKQEGVYDSSFCALAKGPGNGTEAGLGFPSASVDVLRLMTETPTGATNRELLLRLTIAGTNGFTRYTAGDRGDNGGLASLRGAAVAGDSCVSQTVPRVAQVKLDYPQDSANIPAGKINFSFTPDNFRGINKATLKIQREFQEIRIGIIADPHYTTTQRASFPSEEGIRKRLIAFAQEMNRWQPDFVIQLGDLADSWIDRTSGQGSVPHDTYLDWYGKAAKVIIDNLNPGTEFYGIFGNHEQGEVACGRVTRAELRLTFQDQGGIFPADNYIIEKKNYLFVVLNQLLKECHATGGNPATHYYPKEEIEWFRRTVAATGKPVVVFEHVPSFSDREPYDTVEGEKVIRRIMASNDQVIAVFVGHLHHNQKYSFKRVEDGVTYFHTTFPYVPDYSWTRVRIKPVDDKYDVLNSRFIGGGWSETHKVFTTRDYANMEISKQTPVLSGQPNTITQDLSGTAFWRWNVFVDGVAASSDHVLQTIGRLSPSPSPLPTHPPSPLP